MNKVAVALLLVLPACVSQETLDQQREAHAYRRAQVLAAAEFACPERPAIPRFYCIQHEVQPRGYELAGDPNHFALVLAGGVTPDLHAAPANPRGWANSNLGH